jgi:hypothetical protein
MTRKEICLLALGDVVWEQVHGGRDPASDDEAWTMLDQAGDFIRRGAGAPTANAGGQADAFEAALDRLLGA